MKEIKYRQYLKPQFHKNGERFHYWGYIDGGFVSPMGKNETVGDSGQFTGLRDSNGVDIYEGDIVTWGNIDDYIELSGTRYAVVDFSVASEGLVFAAFKPSNHRFKIGSFMYAKSTHKCMTVIGNIHENKELIEVSE